MCDVPSKPLSRFSTFVEAFGLLRVAAKGTAAVAVVVDIVGAIANGALIAIAGKLLGLLASEAQWSDTVPWLIASALALSTSMVTRSLHGDLTGVATEKVESYAVGRVLQAASVVPFSSFDSPAFYDRLERAHHGGASHAWSIVQSTMSLARGILDIVAIMVVLAFVAPVLILVALVAYVPMALVSLVNNRVSYRFSWEETEADRKRGYVEALLSDRRSAKEVRSYGLEDALLTSFRDLWDRRLAHLKSIVRGNAIRSAVASFASAVVVTAALAVVVWLTVQGDLSLDQAGVGVIGVRQLSNGVGRTTADVNSLHHSAQFLGDYSSFRDEAARLAEEPQDAVPLPAVAEIALVNVGFTYPGASIPTLSSVDLTIHAGEVTAVVGANGSGKTTLLALLAGLYGPSTGEVMWDGVDCASFTVAQRQRSVAPLFQDHVQYHFSARQNVAFDSDDDVELGEALRLAGASAMVESLPNGLDTQLGKDFADGVELSIGQWQRLALARAFFRDAPLMLLDEPASALDPGAEAALVQRLREVAKNRCVVMVSHRFASVRQADRIIVLDEGQVIEQGNHDELIAKGGAYCALYRAQTDPLLGVADAPVTDSGSTAPSTPLQ